MRVSIVFVDPDDRDAAEVAGELPFGSAATREALNNETARR
jgi:hypothetical protein